MRFSIIDAIEALTDSPRPGKYWIALKTKLKAEGSELFHKFGTVENAAEDGKIESVMSPLIVNDLVLFKFWKQVIYIHSHK